MAYRHVTGTLYGSHWNATLRLIVPGTPKEMEQGLVGHVCPDLMTGMMFPSSRWPEEENISMWISSVNCPPGLGMIWVRKDGEVGAIESPVPVTDKRTFVHPGLLVIETAAALVEALQLRQGGAFQLR